MENEASHLDERLPASPLPDTIGRRVAQAHHDSPEGKRTVSPLHDVNDVNDVDKRKIEEAGLQGGPVEKKRMGRGEREKATRQVRHLVS